MAHAIENNHHDDDRVRATTIGELDVHLGYVQRDFRNFRNDFFLLSEQLRDMANSIEGLRAELKMLASRLATVEAKVEGQSPRSIVKIITEWATMGLVVVGLLGVVKAFFVLWSKLGGP